MGIDILVVQGGHVSIGNTFKKEDLAREGHETQRLVKFHLDVRLKH